MSSVVALGAQPVEHERHRPAPGFGRDITAGLGDRADRELHQRQIGDLDVLRTAPASLARSRIWATIGMISARPRPLARRRVRRRGRLLQAAVLACSSCARMKKPTSPSQGSSSSVAARATAAISSMRSSKSASISCSLSGKRR